MALLKALKHDEAFERSFGFARLDTCVVKVFASASEAPSVEEESAARDHKGAKALGALTDGMITEALPYLYIRVVLPASGE